VAEITVQALKFDAEALRTPRRPRSSRTAGASPLIRRNGTYTLRIMAFSSILDAWRNDGTLAGIEFD